MSDVVWLAITNKSAQVGLGLGVISNSLLLLLIKVTPTNILGSYKYLMIAFSVFNLFYSIVETFLQPFVNVYDETCFFIQRKRFDYSQTVARAVSATYCGCLACSFSLFAVHFIYRYWTVCKVARLRFFTGYYWLAWFLGIVGTAFSWGLFAFFCFPGNTRTQQSFEKMVQEKYGLAPKEADYVAYTFWVYPEGIRQYDPLRIVGITQHYIVIFVSFSIVFYCGTRTFSQLQETLTSSPVGQQIHKQLFRALVFQTAIPTLFIYIPTLLVFMAPVLDLDIGAYANVTIVMIHLYPGVDPLIMVFLISDFRKAIRSGLQNAWKKLRQSIGSSVVYVA